MEEETCTCGHTESEHAGGVGKCEVEGCPCEAYTEDIDEVASVEDEA